MKQPDLEARISAAFKDGAKSGDFEPLIADAEAASTAAIAAAKRARDRALDPGTPATEVVAARRASEDASFVSDRMQVAAARLRERHRAVAAKEQDARRTIAYNKVVRERDKLAAELASVYPAMAAQLADLLHRIAANNREIAATKLPEGGSRILESELVARNLRGFVLGSQAISIIEETRLPAWEGDAHRRYVYNASDIPMTLTMMRQSDVKIVKV